jgi:hypothetical protein
MVFTIQLDPTEYSSIFTLNTDFYHLPGVCKMSRRVINALDPQIAKGQ